MVRVSPTGVVSGPDERLGAYEALQALTTGPAWQALGRPQGPDQGRAAGRLRGARQEPADHAGGPDPRHQGAADGQGRTDRVEARRMSGTTRPPA